MKNFLTFDKISFSYFKYSNFIIYIYYEKMILLFKTFLLYIINDILFKCIKLIIFKNKI